MSESPRRLAGGGREFCRAGIVRVDDGDARRRIDRAVEEQALGGEIILHRLVVVEVVAGEIGEDGDIEGDAGHAALVEGVAGNFGDELFRAARNAFSHELEEIAGLGRGVNGGTRFAGDVVLDGADEDGGAGGGVEKRLGEKCGRGFAIGAGNAGGGERALGMAEEGRRSLSKSAAAVLDVKDRQAGLVDGEMVEALRGVGDDAQRARGDGFFDIAIAVGRAAFHGDEDSAGAHAPRVVLDAGDWRC